MEIIKELSHELKLGYVIRNYQEEIIEAKHLKKDYETFLIDLLQKEVENRKNNGMKIRLREAKFQHKKFIEDFKKASFSKELKNKFEELETLEFINNKENIILISNPGMGKTHYAVGLGIKAIYANKKVLYISVPNLVIELKESMSKNDLTRYRKKFEKYDLVILDELGYVSFDKEGSEILFNLISNRIAFGSIIITTNLVFDRWEETFKDPILTAAMIDRLAYKSHVLNMSGNSYRVEETRSWLKGKSKVNENL